MINVWCSELVIWFLQHHDFLHRRLLLTKDANESRIPSAHHDFIIRYGITFVSQMIKDMLHLLISQSRSRFLFHDLSRDWFLSRVTRLIILVEQELLALTERMCPPHTPAFWWGSFCSIFGFYCSVSFAHCLLFCPFSFGHCNVCTSIYDF